MADSKKLLIVDDDKDLLYLLQDRLTGSGYSVFTAENAEEALKVARGEKIDLIIMDIVLPGKDGTFVASELKDNPDTRDIPIIFLTGLLSKEEEETKRHKVGGKVFMAKPYDFDDLLQEIDKSISQ